MSILFIRFLIIAILTVIESDDKKFMQRLKKVFSYNLISWKGIAIISKLIDPLKSSSYIYCLQNNNNIATEP